MPRVPFIGRLALREYLALLVSLLLVVLEGFVRLVTLLLPPPLLHLCYRSSRSVFNYLSSPQGRRSRNRKRLIVTQIAQAADFVELCELYGYYAEEHIVQTGDGYLLGLHRLGWRRGEEDRRVNCGEGSLQKKVVYMHHGLMMNSEVWVCMTETERILPFALVERGYDVWLGNNRGNKYSKKCVNCAPTEINFWNFSIDQFAFHDIPDSIDYILKTTAQPSLSYVGFSQGTAQAFATLSIHPTLNDKVDVFIALAPAMSPPGLRGGIVNSLVKASPEVLFLAFGRRALLSSATMWQALLYPPIFVRFIDIGLAFLFGWKTKNITPHQKLAAYPHLYSYTSTKSVVHWFQIIGNSTFQMYDDELPPTMFSVGDGRKYYKVAKFPTRNIKTPIVMVYGGADSLVDINVMLKELPRHTVVKEVPHYEHLDFLWAADTDTFVFPHVFDALERFAHPSSSTTGKDLRAYYKTSRGPSQSILSPRSRVTPDFPILHSTDSAEESSATDPTKKVSQTVHSPATMSIQESFPPSTPTAASGDVGSTDTARVPSPGSGFSTERPRARRLDTPGMSKSGSRTSLEGAGISERGIALGVGRAVGGVTKDEARRDTQSIVQSVGGDEAMGAGDSKRKRKKMK
ncbi:Alpha/Beta hydrolase protein [Lineolata rhizophorae]|uniref:Alpha/Beta hydrolase protein n=1 Tax=Lineolata rhizophorae TaxID=578093 RepID=A0A6A6NQA2_9PEZI|nr:Alpha/Beta hydrolase protein [Lineolata rhizophorae]